eukprot:c18443_g1_i1 orf=78-305(+)
MYWILGAVHLGHSMIEFLLGVLVAEVNTSVEGTCGEALKTLNSQACDRVGVVREAILKINSNSGSKATELDRARA